MVIKKIGAKHVIIFKPILISKLKQPNLVVMLVITSKLKKLNLVIRVIKSTSNEAIVKFVIFNYIYHLW